jgi:hypothetical protein
MPPASAGGRNPSPARLLAIRAEQPEVSGGE